jgi:hypothetical protein
VDAPALASATLTPVSLHGMKYAAWRSSLHHTTPQPDALSAALPYHFMKLLPPPGAGETGCAPRFQEQPQLRAA